MTTTYTVTAPDGAILDIEGPDGATDEQIAMVAARQYGGSAAAATTSVTPMKFDEFRTELRKRIESGMPAKDIRAWGASVRNAEAPTIGFKIGPELEKATERYSQGYKGPVVLTDVSESSKLGAALRGGLDAVTLNNADEIEAAFRSGAISGEEYQKAVDAARAQRAIDAQVNPTERSFGGHAGTVLTAMAPMGRILDAGNLAVRMGKGAAVGAGASGAAGVGSAKNMDEAVQQLPNDLLMGATIGSGIPVAGEAARLAAPVVGKIFSPNFASNKVLGDAEIDVAEVQRRADDIIAAQGRQPSAVELLTPAQAARFTSALAPSVKAGDKVVAEANAAAERIGPRIRNQVPAGSTLDEPGLGIPDVGDFSRPFDQIVPTSEAARPFDRVAPVDVFIGRAQNPEEIRQRAYAFAAPVWDGFRARKFEMNDETRTFLEEAVSPRLPNRQMNEIKAKIAQGDVTIGDMDIVRRALNQQASANKLTGGDDRRLASDVLAYMSEQVPETAEAVGKYATLMRAADGAEVGVMAGNPNTKINDFVAEMLKLTPLERAGVPAGARQQVIENFKRTPADSFRMAAQLEKDEGYQEMLAAAFGRKEADNIVRVAKQEADGLKALFALARVPLDKIESTLESAEGVVNALAVPNAGGAFLAGMVKAMLRTLKIGEKSANQLASKLLDPARRDEAIAAMGNIKTKADKRLYGGWRGLIQQGVAEAGKIASEAIEKTPVLRSAVSPFSDEGRRNAALLSAAQIGKDNARMPEGYVSVENRPEDRPE